MSIGVGQGTNIMYYMFYFLSPIWIAVLLIVASIHLRSIFWINVVLLFFFLTLIFIFFVSIFQKRKISIAIGLSISSIALIFYFIGENGIRRHLYQAEILLGGWVSQPCAPEKGIIAPGGLIYICEKHDFGNDGFVDVIVRIEGSRSAEEVLQDIYLGNASEDTQERMIREAGIWKKSFQYRWLVDDFYLITYKLGV